ncbi:hypothetical protein AAVH_11288 [Aphelenchoides avenae]|nr:hypothetical protein AAVH_11288 [Aphelenchus avenae]
MDAWLDAFLALDRFSLDGVQISTRSFRRLTDGRLMDVCLRRLDNVHVYLLKDLWTRTPEGSVNNSAVLRSETRRVDIEDRELERYSAKLKGALLASTISNLFVQNLSVSSVTADDDAQKCYDFILSASPQSCTFDFARAKDEATPRRSSGQKRAQSQFFTDQRLRECLAHKITELICEDFEEVVPTDAEQFPLGDDGVVDFLFESPELKRKRALTIGHASVSRSLFKRLVQAHQESTITEDIFLDLHVHSFNPQNEMDIAGFEENLVDYGVWADLRGVNSVKYEFPGETCLQIFILENKLQMRRRKQFDWKWTSTEEREWLEEDEHSEYGSENEYDEEEEDDSIAEHSDDTT